MHCSRPLRKAIKFLIRFSWRIREFFLWHSRELWEILHPFPFNSLSKHSLLLSTCHALRISVAISHLQDFIPLLYISHTFSENLYQHLILKPSLPTKVYQEVTDFDISVERIQTVYYHEMYAGGYEKWFSTWASSATFYDTIEVTRMLGVHHLWIDSLCLYLDRYRTKYHRNLRFGPLFSNEFRFAQAEN